MYQPEEVAKGRPGYAAGRDESGYGQFGKLVNRNYGQTQ
jgi:hypothetical protein